MAYSAFLGASGGPNAKFMIPWKLNAQLGFCTWLKTTSLLGMDQLK
jgi:hypothetical protein